MSWEETKQGRTQITVGAAIIYNKQGQILLCKRADGGEVAHQWEFPGGKLEEGESIGQCIVRECEEELGITLGLDGLFMEMDHEYDERTIHFAFYNAHVRHGKIKRRVHEDVAWVGASKLLDYDLCPADRKIAELIAKPEPADVVVVGGGAAGLAAAIEAARAGTRVTLVEKGPRVGSKILATGNGRCNFTNENIGDMDDWYDIEFRHDFASEVVGEHSVLWVLDWFEDMGLVAAKDREGGRVYPRSYQAQSVLDVLLMEAAHLKVRMLPSFSAEMIGSAEDDNPYRFLVVGFDGRAVCAKRVVVASGGGHSILEILGHATVPLRSGLCAFATETEPIAGLDGIRVEALVSLMRGDLHLEDAEGELLFRDYGISGICVFDLSRWYEPGVRVDINFLPEYSFKDADDMFAYRLKKVGYRSAEDFLVGVFARPVARAILLRAGMDPTRRAAEYDAERYRRASQQFDLKVTGLANVENAQVICGGAEVREFNPSTLESKLEAGVYAAGEVLDIDGACGGYNLHWAWASGATAGKAAAESALK